LDTYEFARGLARIMDRGSKIGLPQIVESQESTLRQISDPYRPYKTLMHLIIDIARPEDVPSLMPKGPITVRKAARILTGIVSRSRLDVSGTPAIMDREMYLVLFKAIFLYFLRLLTLDRYSESDMPLDDGQGFPQGEPSVVHSPGKVSFNMIALQRWFTVICEPALFTVIADFLRTVGPAEHEMWYFRIMQAAVESEKGLDEEGLRKLLVMLKRTRTLN